MEQKANVAQVERYVGRVENDNDSHVTNVSYTIPCLAIMTLKANDAKGIHDYSIAKIQKSRISVPW